MNITIIQFSPSGNTLTVSTAIKSIFEQDSSCKVQLVNLAGDKDFFGNKRNTEFLEKQVKPHDILFVGGPVFAHHMQYNVLELIKLLPAPDTIKWGLAVIPFVTYGGITSGIALEESAKLLVKTGRSVIGGLKVSASHRMTRAFLDKEYNLQNPGTDLNKIICSMKDKISQIMKNGNLIDKTKLLCYQPRIKVLVSNVVFNEKKWHRERYPKVFINADKCTLCGICVDKCPVLHLKKKVGVGIVSTSNDCIHCLNCVIECPNRAIELKGDLERGKKFMNRNIQKNGNKELPATHFFF
jgi:ferredoxin